MARASAGRRFVLADARMSIVRRHLREYGEDWRGAGRMLTKIQFPDRFRKSTLVGVDDS